jgi:hypothetical protein
MMFAAPFLYGMLFRIPAPAIPGPDQTQATLHGNTILSVQRLKEICPMRPRIAFKIFLIIVLILLAAPLMGALAVMATGSSIMAQMPAVTNGQMMGLATIWVALILLLIVASIVSIGRSISRAKTSETERNSQEKILQARSERNKVA